VTQPLNVHGAAVEANPEAPAGYHARGARLGPTLGAEKLGATVYELDPGESICPYHYENAEEEWLLVLTGSPTLRDPDGEHELESGDLVCFLAGPTGAHKVTNRSDAVARVVMLSTIPKSIGEFQLSVTVYPDSEKVGVWPPGGRYRLTESLDYWDGEV
jgi:uncharacterized cupin superfamily protein